MPRASRRASGSRRKALPFARALHVVLPGGEAFPRPARCCEPAESQYFTSATIPPFRHFHAFTLHAAASPLVSRPRPAAARHFARAAAAQHARRARAPPRWRVDDAIIPRQHVLADGRSKCRELDVIARGSRLRCARHAGTFAAHGHCRPTRS